MHKGKWPRFRQNKRFHEFLYLRAFVQAGAFLQKIAFLHYFNFQMNSKKGRQVDSSIAQAYIQMIRNAENFIYIENQYFLGSAYTWLQNDDVNCNHTIPVEIAQRIVDKIRMNQRYFSLIFLVVPNLL